jgi:hypothetical protein
MSTIVTPANPRSSRLKADGQTPAARAAGSQGRRRLAEVVLEPSLAHQSSEGRHGVLRLPLCPVGRSLMPSHRSMMSSWSDQALVSMRTTGLARQSRTSVARGRRPGSSPGVVARPPDDRT